MSVPTPSVRPRADSASERPPVASSQRAASRPTALSIQAAEAFGVRLTPAELERTVLLFALLFLAALLLVVGRTARDALFLTRFPVSWIAPMWIAYGVASSIAGLGYAALAPRLPRARFTMGFAIFAAGTYAALRILIGHEVEWAYLVFYVWSEIIANFTAVLIWAIAQDLHDPRSAKRFFGLIGAGRVIGTVACGFGAGAAVALIGTEDLIFVLIAALLAVAVITNVLAARHPLHAPSAATEQALTARLERTPVWRSRYALSVALFTLLLFTVLTIGDYQFKAIASATYQERDRLASFMGFFYGAVGAFGLLVQLVVMPWLLSRHGVLGGLVAMPAAFVACTAALLVHPSLAFAAVLKASDNGLQFTVHDAATQLLLFPFPRALRERVRTLASAAAKPLGYSAGAILLIVAAPAVPGGEGGLTQGAAELGLFSLPLGMAVLALTPLLRQGYITAMRRTLIRREMSGEDVVVGPQTRAIFQEALQSRDAPQVLFAIEKLRELAPDALGAAIPSLARHPSARVRAAALRLLPDLGSASQGADIARAALRDRSARVRVAAVEALAALLREDAHEELCALSDEQDDAIRAAAVAALVRHGGLDGMLDGAPKLRALLDSPAPRDRLAAARALGMAGQPSLQRALARLLRDADPEVRRAAVRAACTVADPRLLPMLVGALAERGLAIAAARAIVAIGAPAIPELAARLAAPEAPRAARLAIPRVLAGIGGPEALKALLGLIDEPDEGIRQKILASASRLRLTLKAPPAPRAEILPRIARELDEHERARDAWLAVRPALASDLLDQHLLRRLRKGLIRALRLCELTYPREEIALARAHVLGPDPALRANAFEVLDALLEHPLSRRLCTTVERLVDLRAGKRPALEGAAGTSAALPPALAPAASDVDAAAWVRAEIRRGDPYSAALALDAAARRRIRGVGPDALAATAHPDPLVREAAAVAVAALSSEGGRERLRALTDDEDPAVAHFARYWVQTGRAGIDEEDTMYTTIEKILFLQRVPLFAGVAGDDLVALARGSLVVVLRKGDVVFREGEPGGSLYSILSGQVALTTGGREISRLGPRDVFGEMSIFDREPRVATATVAEDAELLRVSAEDFHEAVHDTVEIAEAVIRVLNRRLRDADRRLGEARARISLLPPGAQASAPAQAAPGAREAGGARGEEAPLEEVDLD